MFYEFCIHDYSCTQLLGYRSELSLRVEMLKISEDVLQILRRQKNSWNFFRSNTFAAIIRNCNNCCRLSRVLCRLKQHMLGQSQLFTGTTTPFKAYDRSWDIKDHLEWLTKRQ